MPLSRTAASAVPGSLTCSTKTVSLPAATVHNYNNYDQNGKGLRINQKQILVPGKNVIVNQYTKRENQNKKEAKTASQKIFECQKDHLAFQTYLR